MTQEYNRTGRKERKNAALWLLALAGFMGNAARAQDSAVWRASTKYANPAPLRAILLGANYRREWRTPVKLPVFHLAAQGFTIKELGGGQQTISLQLVDRNGRGWSLRSVDKEVTKALPPKLRKTPVKGLVQDLVSGAHPYIPLIIPTLSDAARVIAPVPTIYFVPDDPAFGEYRSLFANTLCLLEEREPTPDKSDTKNTEKLLDRIFESQQVRVDQKALLRARILDMYIGDWDRHSDQWRWGIRDSNKLSVYYPIPRDRDQAFFYSEGLLVKFVQLMALRHLVSFDDDLAKVKSLNYKMWPFDMLLLNGLDRPQWKEILTELQAAFTDDVIHEAMAHLPPEIYALRGARLEKKLRERREDLVRQGLHYYRFISARVDVYGTNAAETFEVSGMGSDVVVKVYAMKGDGRGGLLYERRFVKDDTEVVRLFGLRGNDRFVVADGVKSRIRIELHGEDGDDRYEVGSGRVKVVE